MWLICFGGALQSLIEHWLLALLYAEILQMVLLQGRRCILMQYFGATSTQYFAFSVIRKATLTDVLVYFELGIVFSEHQLVIVFYKGALWNRQLHWHCIKGAWRRWAWLSLGVDGRLTVLIYSWILSWRYFVVLSIHEASPLRPSLLLLCVLVFLLCCLMALMLTLLYRLVDHWLSLLLLIWVTGIWILLIDAATSHHFLEGWADFSKRIGLPGGMGNEWRVVMERKRLA